MIEYDRKHTTMSQAPTSSLWTEDDDLTDEEEDQTLLGDDAYVEPVVPAEASRREDRRGLRVLAVVSLPCARLRSAGLEVPSRGPPVVSVRHLSREY